MLLSSSVAFAATEDASIEEVDDGIVDDAVSLEDETGDIFEDAPTNDDVVTNSTFYNYFSSTGDLLSNVTSEELVFDGDFTGVGVSNINITKPIKLTGNNATFSGVSFTIATNNVVFDGFNLAQNNRISVIDATNVTVSNNLLNYNALMDESSNAIFANYVSNLRLLNNVIMYVGNTTGAAEQDAIRVSQSERLLISGNMISANIPAGGGSVINLDSSFKPTLENNTISYGYNGIVGYGSTNAVYLTFGCDDAVVYNNVIDVVGASYVYGITVYGSNFTIDDNLVMVSSDVYYACGVNPDAGASGIVKNNEISVSAPVSAYGIYSGMWTSSAPLVVDYVNNTILGDSFFACGIEIGGAKENVIGNTIDLEGNYTMGIALYKYAQDTINTTISNNEISAMGTNVGDASSVWDSVGVETTGIKITAGNITVYQNNINSTAGGIYVAGDIIGLTNNTVDVVANEMVNNYAITAINVDDLSITGNDVYFMGNNNGSLSSNGVTVSSVGSLVMSGNTIDVIIPAGGGSAIYLENSNAPIIADNEVNFDYEGIVGYGSTNVVYLSFGCDDAVIYNNGINSFGASYVYGITVYGANFTIDDNLVMVSSDVYYACGVNPDAGASGIVKNNEISVSAPVSAYGIYSGMWTSSAPLVVDYVNNTILGDSFFACGIEIGGAKENVIGNTIDLEGNYTMGIALYKYAQDTINTTISNNEISAMGTNVGDASSVWDSVGVETTGIKITAGNVTVSGNNVKTTGAYAIVIGDASGSVSNNSLVAKSIGNAAIKVKSSVDISGTGPIYKTILVASDLTKAYGTTNQFVVKVLDENGDFVANKTITLNVGGKDIVAVSDAKGVAKFNINLAVGKYDAETSFAGDGTYGPKKITNKIVVNKAATNIIANKKTFKVSVKTKKYTITLKANNKAINKKVKVTLKVKGKTYTAYTNSKGKATFKITKLTNKGTYTAKIKFAGNANYKASSKSVKITVK